jgi:hypothetical protein
LEVGISTTTHGNHGRMPSNACTEHDRSEVRTFIINFAETHGMPDPGRDLRHGNGRLRILLPSVLNYTSVHRSYHLSLLEQDEISVGYKTFVRVWQDNCPHVVFNKPRTDLCMTCENFKKDLNRISSDLNEKREIEKERVYKSALAHIEHAKTERSYYKACSKLAESHYQKLGLKNFPKRPIKANTRNIMQHYSWDFAQQLLYPYEDQQVGPIYFKTARKCQLFGVCCEGIPRQTNYLIDEANFPEKDANTVISLLDHFFRNHGLGEKYACLTADNCVGQNKNNAVLQYLVYRVLAGLHDNIELSFMLVGHTKFAPDGYFGLIRKRYRRSNVYTFEDLEQVVEKSSEKGHNACQSGLEKQQLSTPLVFRDWTTWLKQFFKKLPEITSYRHFKITKSKPGIVELKTEIGGSSLEVSIYKKDVVFKKGKKYRLPLKITPNGLSLERQWYLYDQIRSHIPGEKEKNATCPKPRVQKPKKVADSP